MEKFEELKQKSLETWTSFNLIEVILFEIYLISAGFFLCSAFPGIIHTNPKLFFVYLVLFLLWTFYTFYIYFKKNKSLEKRWKLKWFKIHLLKNFSYIDFAIYKITVILFAIILCYFFPKLFLQSYLVSVYTFIFWFWMWYFIAKVIVGNSKK